MQFNQHPGHLTQILQKMLLEAVPESFYEREIFFESGALSDLDDTRPKGSDSFIFVLCYLLLLFCLLDVIISILFYNNSKQCHAFLSFLNVKLFNNFSIHFSISIFCSKDKFLKG